MHERLRDLGLGARSLRQRPTYGLVVVLTLTLGIGANTLIVSLMNAVWLRPLPYAAPDRLVALWSPLPAIFVRAGGDDEGTVSGADFTD